MLPWKSLFLAGVGVALFAGRASAVPITYTETVESPGSLGAEDFAPTLITYTVTADSSGVVEIESGEFANFDITSATIDIAGVATVSVLDSYAVLVEQGFAAGMLNDYGETGMLTVSDAFDSYDLTTSIGPVVGNTYLNSPLDTTGGEFSFIDPAATTTFQATTAVPEPVTIATATLCLPALGLFLWKRRRTA